MHPVYIIEKKKSGESVSRDEIKYMVDGFLRGEVKDYQMSAFLMAVWFRGMNSRETVDLTRAMLRSGETLAPGPNRRLRVDKHSTGGVGDKVSLALAPLAASCGLRVPMLSGRSLGHTGGTLDKLESIPGFRSSLSSREMEELIAKAGCFIAGQTQAIAPADRKIYALRDVTGTVDCIPLIVSSILSKKLSEGISALVMDVKYGSGAFMRNLTEARKLAGAVKRTGEHLGLRVTALLTPMHQPLGCAVGNALEVIEAVELLRGRASGVLHEVTRALACEMLLLSGLRSTRGEAERLIDKRIRSGAAFRRFKRWVELQGGKLDFRKKDLGLELAGLARDVTARENGFVHQIDARCVGLAVADLGGGRREAESEVDHGVGVVFHRKTGDRVKRGETVFTIYARDEHTFGMASERLASALIIRKEPFRIKGREIHRL